MRTLSWLPLGVMPLFLTGTVLASSAPGARPRPVPPAMERLSFLVGQWRGVGKTEAPAGSTRQRRSFTEMLQSTWVGGGSYLMAEMQVRWPDEPLERALMLIGYDADAKRYRLSWFFAGSSRPGEWSGGFEGTKLVLTNEQELREKPSSFTGIGLQLERTPDKAGDFKVHLIIPNTPAARAGLKPGDLIRAINGRPVKQMTVAEGLDLMRGPSGSNVRLTVRRVGRDREVTLARQNIVLSPEPVRVTFAPASPSRLSELIEIQHAGRYRKQTEVTFTAGR